MVKCQICGTEKKISIVEHLRHTHHLTCKEYRVLYKNAEVKSDEAKKLISEQNKKVWENDAYKEKMSASRQITHRTESFRNNQSERLKKVYASGLKSWNVGLTRHNDERLENIGKKNSNHLTGRTKEDYEYLQIHSEKMRQLAPIFFSREKWSDEKIEAWKEKISRTVSEGISEGKYSSPVSGYKHGWYIRANLQEEFYQSSWELEVMQYLDEVNVVWTKCHGIVIQYGECGYIRRYIPDFLITYRDKKFLIELKGYDRSPSETMNKKKAAEIWAELNSCTYKLCRSVDEVKNEIFLMMKDEQNETFES